MLEEEKTLPSLCLLLVPHLVSSPEKMVPSRAVLEATDERPISGRTIPLASHHVHPTIAAVLLRGEQICVCKSVSSCSRGTSGKASAT